MRRMLRLAVRALIAAALLGAGAIAGALAVLVGLRLLVAQAGLDRAEPAANEPILFGVAGGMTLRSEARALRRITLLNVAGGAEIDLTGATLDAGGARLEVATAAGGTAITVPCGWEVALSGRAIAGEASDATQGGEPPPAGAPRLEIHALTFAGGFIVKRPDAVFDETDGGEAPA